VPPYCHAGNDEKYLPRSKIQSSSQKKGKGIFQATKTNGNGAMQVCNKNKTQFSVGIKGSGGRKNSATTRLYINSECDSENDVIGFLFLAEKSIFTRKDDGTPHVEGQNLAQHVLQEKYMSVKRN